MDEQEFQRLLNLFPVVRSRDFQLDLNAPRRPTSQLTQNEADVREWQDAWDDKDNNDIHNKGFDEQDAFWVKLKLAAEKKVSSAEAERFCKAFQQIHKKLVCEGLSTDAAQRFMNTYPKHY